MSSYILEYIPKIFPLIEANNITSLIVPAGYNANVVIPLTLQENETKTYVVIGNKNVIDNYQDSDFITYISSKDMITLLLSYLDKKNDINDLCDIIILSELYPGELYYETIFSLWLYLENIFDGIPRLIILNSKPYEVPNSAKFEIKNPITPKYEYIDISKDKLYREIAKLIKNKIKLDNFNMVVIVPNIEELDPYLETYAKTEIKTDLYIADEKLSNKILLITTPDKVPYNYLPNTRYVIDLLVGTSVDSETAKQHESLINVAKNGIFTRMISKEDYGKLPKKFKYNLDQTELIGIMVEILKVKVSPDSILKNIDKSLITNLIKLIDKINLVDIPKLNNFVDSLNLNFRNSSFLWYWIRGDRFNSRIIEEGKKYDMNFEEIEIDQSSLFSSIEPYHLPSISAIFDSEKLNPEIIIDATANIGGDSINFMRLFPSARLTSLELDTKISYILKRNMNNLKNILSQDNDYDTRVFNISAVDYFSEPRYADMIYFDPPWGGRDYIKIDRIQLYLDDIGIGKIIKNILIKGMTPLVILKLPVNADIDIIKSDIGSEINVTYSLYDVENYNKNKVAYQLMFIKSENIKRSSKISPDPEEVELIPTTNPVFGGIVITCLIDTFKKSYFKFPEKSRNYTQSQYDKILADHKKKYFDKYKGYNDLETFLNMYNDYFDHNDDVDVWIKENSIDRYEFIKLIEKINDLMNTLREHFTINLTGVNSKELTDTARPILASVYSDLTYINPYKTNKKLYFNELNPSEKYSLDKNGINEMLKTPPLGIIALHTKVFKTDITTIKLIDFGIDTDKTGRGLPILEKEDKNIVAVPKLTPPKLGTVNLRHDILKQNPFDILDSLMINHQIYPIILKSIDIDVNNITLLKIAKKITGNARITSSDLVKILEDFQNVNIDTAWASKTIKSNDRFDDILKYIDTSNVNTYLDIGSGDAVDFNFMVSKLNPERSISVDVKDSRLEKSFEFHILEIDNPLLLPGNSVDIITIFHALHHSSDALFRLRDVYRLLKIEGLFILKDHNVTNLDVANNVSFEHFVYSIGEGTATLENAKNYNDIEPMYYYSADYIKNYLINLGFEVVMFETFNNPTRTYKAIFRKKDPKIINNLLEKEYIRYTYVEKILKVISNRSDNTYESKNSVERWLLSMANFAEDRADVIFSTDVLDPYHRFNRQLNKELIEKSGFNSKSADKTIYDIIEIIQEFLEGKYKISSDSSFTIDDGLFTYRNYSRQITPERMEFLRTLGADYEIARMLLRYASILPGSQHWNMPIETFKEYYRRGIRIEGFASPVNAQLITIDKQNCKFCSLFPDVDKPFGSIGNFFTTSFQGQQVSVGPPYTVELFDKISTKLKNECSLAEKNNNKVLFYVTFSAWEDTEGFQNILNSKYTHFAAILPARSHFYTNSNGKVETDIIATFSTVFFDMSVGHKQLDHTHLFDSMSATNKSIKLEILKS